MNLDLSPEDHAFREQIRAFMAGKLPPAIKRRVVEGLTVTKRDIQDWQAIRHAQGYGAPGWPAAHGGRGWSSIRDYIFENKLVSGGAPMSNLFVTKLVGPVILAHGTEDQKRQYLPRILTMIGRLFGDADHHLTCFAGTKE